MERTPYESISRLMSVIELSSDIVKVAPYKEEIDSIQRGLSTLSLSPCMAWETVLRMKEKYGKEPIVIDVVIGDGSRKLC